MRKMLTLAAVTMSLVAGAARAEVTDRSPAGFEVTEKVGILAPRAKVWAALMTPAAWWNSQHSWSGDARNLTLDLANGCFCEKLAGGFVRHMTLTYVDQGAQLRMFGGLGPLQFTGAAGHMGIALKDSPGGTDLTLTYDVGGYAKGGLAEHWAAPVDTVLAEQVARLKRYVETGRPEVSAAP